MAQKAHNLNFSIEKEEIAECVWHEPCFYYEWAQSFEKVHILSAEDYS